MKRTWPEDRWPTAEEWRDAFLKASPSQQLHEAQRMIEGAQEGFRCLTEAHDYRFANMSSDSTKP